MEELIEMINVCIHRLNHVKQVLNDELKTLRYWEEEGNHQNSIFD